MFKEGLYVLLCVTITISHAEKNASDYFSLMSVRLRNGTDRERSPTLSPCYTLLVLKQSKMAAYNGSVMTVLFTISFKSLKWQCGQGLKCITTIFSSGKSLWWILSSYTRSDRQNALEQLRVSSHFVQPIISKRAHTEIQACSMTLMPSDYFRKDYNKWIFFTPPPTPRYT